MSRPPRRRRPRRVWRWEGHVMEFGLDSFWAELIPVDHDGPTVHAEFDLWRLPDAREGTVFTVYVHRKGRKRRYVMREKNLGVWTAEELDAARAKAKTWVADHASWWLDD